MLLITGIALIIVGVVALVRKPDPESKRKTTPAVAIAMIAVGVAIILFAEIVLTRYLQGA